MQDISLILNIFINKFNTTIIQTLKLFTFNFSGNNGGQATVFTLTFLSFIISINILLGLINIFKRKG